MVTAVGKDTLFVFLVHQEPMILHFMIFMMAALWGNFELGVYRSYPHFWKVHRSYIYIYIFYFINVLFVKPVEK